MTDTNRIVMAIFATESDVRAAHAALLAQGTEATRIVLSRDLTEDSVAAEHPGQSFENQPGQGNSPAQPAPISDFGPDSTETSAGRWNTLVRSGHRAISVDITNAVDADEARSILLSHGGKLLE